jgi:hypothetical protein
MANDGALVVVVGLEFRSHLAPEFRGVRASGDDSGQVLVDFDTQSDMAEQAGDTTKRRRVRGRERCQAAKRLNGLAGAARIDQRHRPLKPDIRVKR